MSKLIKSHWQYVTLIFTMIATLIRLSYKEGEFRQKCAVLETTVQVIMAESLETKRDIVDINLSVKEIKTMLNMMQKPQRLH